MKAFPDIRGLAPPPRAYWLANFIPCVQIWASEIHIGFWRSTHSGAWNPVMRRPFLAINKFGVWWRRGP